MLLSRVLVLEAKYKLTKNNPTNFCLCYSKLLLPAAILADIADSGVGLEIWILPQSLGTALPPQKPHKTTKAPGSGPGPGISHGSPRTDPHPILNSLGLLSSPLCLADDNFIIFSTPTTNIKQNSPLFLRQQRFLEVSSPGVDFYRARRVPCQPAAQQLPQSFTQTFARCLCNSATYEQRVRSRNMGFL